MPRLHQGKLIRSREEIAEEALKEEDFFSLYEKLGKPAHDLMLVSDGSGSTWDKACGWACGYRYRTTKEINLISGGSSCGTNNHAELAPFIHALSYHEAKHPESLPLVLCISDSELTCHCATGKYGRNVNLSLWASYDHFVRRGYRFSWHWVPRNSNRINSWCDERAGVVRKKLP